MNTVVPFAVEFVWRELDRGQFSNDFDPFGIRPFIQRRLDFSARLGSWSNPMSSMITSWLTSGRPRQFCVM
jgi:hypothetical protein